VTLNSSLLTPNLHAKFHLDLFNHLATVHERQTDKTGQRSDSIGRTVLQTVAQKLLNEIFRF